MFMPPAEAVNSTPDTLTDIPAPSTTETDPALAVAAEPEQEHHPQQLQ